MSLSSLALRLAVIEALKPAAAVASANAGGSPTWPTLARANIRNTLIDPVDIRDVETLPIVAIYTERLADENDGADLARAEPARTVAVRLAIEMMLPVRDDEDMVYAAPTDATSEAILDLLQSQILRALDRARTLDPLALVLRSVTETTVETWADPDNGIKLNGRRLELGCHIQREDWSQVGGSGLARLPEPLRAVAEKLPEGSAGRLQAEQVADALTAPTAMTALEEIRLSLSFARETGSAPPPAGGDFSGSVPT